MDKQLAWLESAQIQRPGAAADLSELGELYDRKLWHPLTLKLNAVLEQSSFQQGGFLVDLYRCYSYMKLPWEEKDMPHPAAYARPAHTDT